MKTTANVVGFEVVAIRPPARPPSPKPRFIVRRCVANATARRSGGVRPAMREDCDGQNVPMPIPTSALVAKPCHGSWMSGYRA